MTVLPAVPISHPSPAAASLISSYDGLMLDMNHKSA